VPLSFKVVPSPEAAPTALTVSIQDELTFFDPAQPLLVGASVSITNDAGQTVASGVTNANGTVVLPGLLEGFYRISASALNHSSSSKVLTTYSSRRRALKLLGSGMNAEDVPHDGFTAHSSRAELLFTFLWHIRRFQLYCVCAGLRWRWRAGAIREQQHGLS